MLLEIHPSKRGLKNNPFSDLLNRKTESLPTYRIQNRKKIFEILSESECQSCGKCCNGELYQRVSIHSADPNLANIQTKLEKKAKKLSVLNNSNYMECQNGCPFLVNNSCDIYPIRPQTCRSYPFGVSNHTIILIDSCPAILRIANEVSGYVLLDDLMFDINNALLAPNSYVFESRNNKFIEQLTHLKESGFDTYLAPFLGASLMSLFSQISSAKFDFSHELISYIARKKGEFYFPIKISDLFSFFISTSPP